MTGAEIAIRCIEEQRGKTVFGYPGGRALKLYDALYQSGLSHILMTNEQHAVNAAVGYARASGRCGVVLATSGPGATNLVTGIANAYMDSAPVVILTCNVPRGKLGTDAFQEIDIAGVTMPITKYNTIVGDAAQLADTVRFAFRTAMSGRKGPVLVDIPEDVLYEEADYAPKPPEEAERAVHYSKEELARAAELINKSRKPAIYAGGGVIAAGAQAELAELQERTQAPVGMSMMGLGAYPPGGRGYVGMIGAYGRKRAAAAMDECDLLIAVGARFSERTAPDSENFAKNAKVLHIDADAAEVNKNRRTDAFLIGDARLALSALLPGIEQKRAPWLDENNAAEWDGGVHISCRDEFAFRVFRELDRAAGDRVIYTTDVGDHQLWVTKYLEFGGDKRLITSGGLGAMGFGLGAAVGASIGAGNARVINISGDGSFYMNMAELATVARLGLPVVDVVINNRALGLVRRQQRLFFEGRESQSNTDWNTDYVKLAEAMGIAGFRIRSEDDVAPVMKKVMERDMGALIEIEAGEE
ncbi:MAG: biosynthetic-type acetolactate synthase large subunit [Clostridiales bacterium]|nr:MAG: biosynthetic-type acetolactate synthase large subunit [Clostridiales bacterium]